MQDVQSSPHLDVAQSSQCAGSDEQRWKGACRTVCVCVFDVLSTRGKTGGMTIAGFQTTE